MLVATDKSLKCFPGYKSVLSEDWLPDMDSHVMMAACREYEFVKEKRRKDGFNGIFTQDVVRALKSGQLGEGSTYVDLVNSILARTTRCQLSLGKISMQNCVCEVPRSGNGDPNDWHVGKDQGLVQLIDQAAAYELIPARR
ncbi:uncharacterized protein BT62DRAFT_996906 [Guyanagaster necrorhizus]|uniref:Uncharacterized protein n=1 Tax=Guyanagaster necrorhizus TaxID=856835 RepID=A0A9P7VK16_9AGAR|nr:uncharacterized protein BT62DRAFT_996906 [Guyanagaster necrorhizus MCA 3950]KAG7441998.1 hypothetical protein BT62DRAFT_996906 [Guyanagaster necrorhizus MCA 3950]